MSNDIRDILSKLTALEGKLSPVSVKKGLTPGQEQAHQMPALFKPKKISVLGAKTDPQHPAHGMAVGSNESVERTNSLAEAMAEIEEDMLSKVRRDLTQYLDKLEQKVKADPELMAKAVDDVEDANPAKAGKQKSHDPNNDDVEEDATETGELARDVVDNQMESHPVKTVECWPGALFEIHGDEQSGFEIRHRGRRLPSRFNRIDDADMALKLFKAHRDNSDPSADYIEER